MPSSLRCREHLPSGGVADPQCRDVHRLAARADALRRGGGSPARTSSTSCATVKPSTSVQPSCGSRLEARARDGGSGDQQWRRATSGVCGEVRRPWRAVWLSCGLGGRADLGPGTPARPSRWCNKHTQIENPGDARTGRPLSTSRTRVLGDCALNLI
jgi:hypothetical protein